ncbi:MAG: ComEC/Rec2 family competence protein [bacterium]
MTSSKIITFCYSFIAGVGIAMGLFANFDVFRPLFSFSSLFILHWLLILSGVLILLWIILGKNFVTRNVFIILVPFILGATNYWRFFNTNFPNHMTKFLDEKFWDKTGIRGTVIREPDVRPDKTNLTVKPFEIKKKDGWKKLKGKTGNVLVQVKPCVGEYYETCDYGDIIEVHAALMIPMEKQNPGAFDYKEYLRSMWGIYACMYPRQPEQIKKFGEDSGWLLKFALDLKKRMICTVKKTIPFPESAFLGGVTLGTRGGVPPQMKFEFQATGVAHVLSVSGLHAGFIALLFFMLCSLFKIPPKPRWLIVSFGLLIFTLITGARPATMRSSIMYSMLLFFNTFGLGLKASAALTIPVSGCIILFFNPLLAPSASFVLSYVAVWSLVYLSGPTRAFFEAYVKSWFFIVFFLWVFFFTALVCVSPLLYKNGSFLLFIAAAVVLTILAAGSLEKILPIDNLSMNMLPASLQGLVQFFYSQFAIQIGMMIPLSAVYFHRFPAAGVYANFIAIPLIGFIVMVGFLAGLLEAFFSVLGLGAIGVSSALVLNAGNYWLTKLFTGVAHFFFKAFPYPFMPTLRLKAIVVYYGVVLLIAFYKPILDFFETLKQRLKYLSREELILRISAIVFAVVLLTFLYNDKFGKKEAGKFKLTVMAVGFGNCNIIRTPSGKNILVDTTRIGEGDFNFQNLAAAFTLYHINGFENLVLTNLKPENTGNAALLLPYFPAKKITTSYDPDEFCKRMSYQKFLSFLDDESIKEKWDGFYAQALYTNWHFLVKAPLIPHRNYQSSDGLKKIFSGRKGFPLHRTKRGDILYSERAGKKDFIIRVLWPEEKKIAGTEDDIANNSIVLKVTYGDFSMLIPSDIKFAAQEEMAARFPDELKSDVLIAPYHGHMDAGCERWFNAVGPSLVVIPYIYDKGWSFYDSDLNPTIRLCSQLGARVLRLDRVGAVTIVSDGTGEFGWESVKKMKTTTTGEASFEDSLDVF